MAKPWSIELPGAERIAILYEDRSVLALDKPRGWMLAPESWQNTSRNLFAALRASLEAGDFWARSRNLRFLRFAHRLDAETTGVLLLAKSPGALRTYSELFETRRMQKRYLAVVEGVPSAKEWMSNLRLAPSPGAAGRMVVDSKHGKEAQTKFRVLQQHEQRALVEALPLTGRTHQIRVHLASSGCAVVGDALYGRPGRPEEPLALRAVSLSYTDPFTRRPVVIEAPVDEFLRQFGFSDTSPLNHKGPEEQRSASRGPQGKRGSQSSRAGRG